jgi:hypothetical protein
MMIMSTNRKDKNAWGIPSMETYLTSIKTGRAKPAEVNFYVKGKQQKGKVE